MNALVPKPFGLKDSSGNDIFEQNVQNKLSTTGLAVTFIDDWDCYHYHQGEVHCGTNATRTPPSTNWW